VIWEGTSDEEKFLPVSGQVNFLMLRLGQPPMNLENFLSKNPKFQVFSLRVKKISSGCVKKYPGQVQVSSLFTEG